MYNRYIPQPDGSFCRRQVPEDLHPKPQPISPQTEAECPREPCPDTSEKCCKQCSGCRKKPHQQESAVGIHNCLSQLLPKDFDTGDLMVILLLLLIAGDCPENQSNALLTLALYLFL